MFFENLTTSFCPLTTFYYLCRNVEIMESFKTILFGKTDSTTVQIIRNAVVELIRYSINIAILWFLNEKLLGDDYLPVSTAIASLLAGLVNFFLSSIWVFHKKEEGKSKNAIKFLIFTLIGAAGLGINIGITTVLTNKCGVYFLISNTIAQIVVFFFNFFMRKKIVFER